MMAEHWILVVICLLFMVASEAQPDIPTNYSSSVLDHPEVSPRLLYGETHGVSWSDLSVNHRLPPLVSRVYLDVLGMDFHYRHQWLFYSGLGQIWRMSMDQDGRRSEPEVVVREAGGATSVVVDWLQDRVYWLSPATKTVRRSDLAGAGQEVVLKAVNISRSGNIVLDPYSGLMFLTLDINSGGVLRAGLEESAHTRVTVKPENEKLQEVVSLALDVRHRRLFITAREDFLPTILSCGYDGSAVRRYDLSATWWHQVTALGTLGERLFWVHHDWPGAGAGAGSGPDTVWKTNSTSTTSGGGELGWAIEYRAQAKLLDPNNRIWALKVYHPDVQSPPRKQEVTEDEEEVSSYNSGAGRRTCFLLYTLLSLMIYFTNRIS